MTDAAQIPIFFSVNNEYAPYLDVALRSIKAHRGNGSRYRIHILYTNLSMGNIERLEQESEENIEIRCIDISEKVTVPEVSGASYLSREAIYRILLPQLFTEYHKALYLDCDIIVLDDLRKLYETRLGNALVGAVKNPCNEELAEHIEKNVGIPYSAYFNSGVLVIDMDGWRREQIGEKAIQEYESGKEKYIWVDQDVLNIVCRGRVNYLLDKWNFEWHYMRGTILKEYEESYQEASEAPKIIHYTSDKKPWAWPSFPKAEYFWNYARQSVYYEEILFRNVGESVTMRENGQSVCFRNWVFPYDVVRRGSRVVLYAAGAVGTAFYQQMLMTDYCRVILWVDKNYEQLRGSGFPVEDISKIEKKEYDYVVIAVEYPKIAIQIKEILRKTGVPEEKIVWKNPKKIER